MEDVRGVLALERLHDSLFFIRVVFYSHRESAAVSFVTSINKEGISTIFSDRNVYTDGTTYRSRLGESCGKYSGDVNDYDRNERNYKWKVRRPLVNFRGFRSRRFTFLISAFGTRSIAAFN